MCGRAAVPVYVDVYVDVYSIPQGDRVCVGELQYQCLLMCVQHPSG